MVEIRMEKGGVEMTLPKATRTYKDMQTHKTAEDVLCRICKSTAGTFKTFRLATPACGSAFLANISSAATLLCKRRLVGS